MLLVTAGNSDMDTLLMAIDDDGDGRVGVDEFIAAFKSLGVEKNLERERKKKKRRRIKEVRKQFLVSTFCVNMIILPRQARDTHRESTQKERTTVFLQARRIRKLAGLFEEFDTNNDGVVDTRELWEGCHRFGLTPDVEQIKLMVARADNGYDGTRHATCHNHFLNSGSRFKR
jgi:Ca2+-binding EF-hand superfamily protein